MRQRMTTPRKKPGPAKYNGKTTDKLRRLAHFRSLVRRYLNKQRIPKLYRFRDRVKKLPPVLSSAIQAILWSQADKAVDKHRILEVAACMGYSFEEVLIYPRSENVRTKPMTNRIKAVLRKVRGK